MRMPIFALMLGVLLAALGCAQPASEKLAFRFPWQQVPEKIPGVKTPRERIDELDQLAESKSFPPGTAEGLAREIQNEQDPQVRLHIVRVMAKLTDRQAAAVLHAGLEDPAESVRVACCEAWGERGGSEAVEELTTVLEAESNIDVRMAAAKALGVTKQPAAVKPLSEVLADSDPAIQRRAIDSLKNVSGKDYGYDLQAWRQYAAGENVQKQEVSIAERVRGWVKR